MSFLRSLTAFGLATCVVLPFLWSQTATNHETAASIAFRDAVVPAPKKTAEPVFKLSHDYPQRIRDNCPECAWLNIPVPLDKPPNFPPETVSSPKWYSEHWNEYLQAILKYVKEGQDPQLRDEVGWTTKVNGRTRWFNVPWMAYDPTAGREWIHGTTNERTATLSEFVRLPNEGGPSHMFYMAGETDACKAKYPWGFESWSVGYYNEFGGYALGKTIPASGVPQMSDYLGTTVPAGLPFPRFTVVVKILTSNAPEDCVPYLKGSPQWNVDRHKYTEERGYDCKREVQADHVVQVDVAVVDLRSPTRWVYGTFAYNTNLHGKTFWDNLAPVGLQWGSDPWTFPAVPESVSLPLQQSVANPDVGIFQHYGCNKRLAGPVDNPQSSCTSCHSSAYAAPNGAPGIMGGITKGILVPSNVPPSFGFDGMCQAYSLDNSAYFQNQSMPQKFPGGKYGDAIPLDTSLQLAVAFTQYGYFHTDQHPQKCEDPNQIQPTIERVKTSRKQPAVRKGSAK